MDLPRFLLPQRIASINALEVIFEFAPFPRQEETQQSSKMSDIQIFHSFLDSAPRSLGAIQSLYISFQGQLRPRWSDFSVFGDEWYKFTETVIMKPIDEMVRKLGPSVKDISIAIPASLYASRRNRTREEGGIIEQTIHGGHLERYWRPLDLSVHRPGYWVRLGQKDLTLPKYACVGFIDDLTEDEEDWVLYGNEWRS